MLRQVVLETSTPMVFNIEGVNPEDVLIIKSISGLSSTSATLFTGEFATEGGYYQGRRSGKRNPVFTFKMNPDYVNDIAISDIREMVYDAFHQPSEDSDGVKVVLQDDRRPDRYFIGYTESIDSSQFERNQTIMVSMVCTEFFLQSYAEVNQTNPAGWSERTFDYDGSAPVGLEMTAKVITDWDQVKFDLNGQILRLDTPDSKRGFLANDVLVINTQLGTREVTLINVVTGDPEGAMGYLTADSKFLKLRKGSNTLKVYGETENDGKAKLTGLRYRSAWWGI